MSNTYLPRITQLDASDYNSLISELVFDQLLSTKKYLKPGILECAKPELKFLVDLLLLRGTFLQKTGVQTLGQKLFGIQYENPLTKRQSAIYLFFNCFIPYISEKCDKSLKSSSQVRIIVNRLTDVLKIVEFINLLMFLRNGMFPTLSDRILGLKHVSVGKLNSNMSYNFMVRELLWHSFMEFLMFSMPLVNFSKLKRMSMDLVKTKNSANVQITSFSLEANTNCCICRNRPNTPCRISLYCKHIACYYCLQANILADKKFSCPDCGAESTAVNALQYC